MNLGQVQIAIGLDPRLFDGIIRFLYRNGTIPPSFAAAAGSIDVELAEPRIEIRDPDTNPRIGLHLQGSFSASGGADTPFDAWVRLRPVTRSEPGKAPVAALEVDAAEDLSPPIIAPFFDQITDELLTGFLAELEIPLFDGLIGALEIANFGATPPPRDQWATAFRLGESSQIDRVHVGFPPGQPDQPHVNSVDSQETEPALVATLALPSENPDIPGNPSIVPAITGMQILISRTALDTLLAASAQAKIGTDIEGATIQSLTMQMHDLGIDIHGNAEKSGADINWDGVLLLFFRKFFVSVRTGAVRSYGGFVDIFASGIDVDVDLPWYVTLLRVLFFFLGPIGWLLDSLVLEPQLDGVDEAPDLVQDAFSSDVQDAFEAMLENVGGLADSDEAPMMLFGHDAWILNGHYAYTFIALAGYNRAQIVSVEHDSFTIPGARGKSVGFLNLDTGHRLSAGEAGRLLKSGILEIPGHHGVQAPYGYYVRSNPTPSGDDNLVPPGEIIEI
ncbi:MAG: hypothetical protein U9R25_13060 [Chloroflexota bacterium]|nr:hypothetical protein [Chloroflexota bacterium]